MVRHKTGHNLVVPDFRQVTEIKKVINPDIINEGMDYPFQILF